MMKIWRYLPIILLILLCGGVTATETVLSTAGGTVAETCTGDIAFSSPTPDGGVAIHAISQNPDEYTLANVISVDIARFDLSSESCGGAEKQITFGGMNHVNPRVADGKVVYEEWNSGVSSIGMYDIASGEQYPVYPGMLQQSNPDISGQVIVYEQAGSSSNPITNIFAYDLKTQTGTPVDTSTSNQNQPSVSGRYVVWQDWRSGNPDIYLADLNSGTSKPITKDLSEQKKPDISGSFVVWEDWRNGNADIYLYDIKTEKEFRLTSNTADQTNPRISGNFVVWEDNRNGISDIYAMNLDNFQEYKLTNGKAKATNPDVSGPLVTWEDWRNGNADIYLLDLVSGYIYQVTNNRSDQTDPSIYGPYLVWQDKRAENSQIFLYTFTPYGTSDQSSQQQGTPASARERCIISGSALINSQNAPAGTIITATIDNKMRGQYTLTTAGSFSDFNIPISEGDYGKVIVFTAASGGSSYQAGQQFIAGQHPGGHCELDFGSSAPAQNTYVISGSALINSQNAPAGTIITATIDNQIRGQYTLTAPGSVSDFNIPINQNDSGKVIIFTASSGGSSYQAGQQFIAGQRIGGRLDLNFGTYASARSSYTFSGSAWIDNQYAPVGTVISAVVDNQIRGQVSVTTAGQYYNLNIPVYQTDTGKYLSFTANWNGATYTAGQQVALQGGQQGGEIIIASADITAESSTVNKRLDLTFTRSTQSNYQFWGRANLDGSQLTAGSTIYAIVDGQVRGQITLQSPGYYGSENGPFLQVPFTSSDLGKTISFQTSSGATGDQTQLIVSGLKVQKNINFVSKPATSAQFTATPTQGAIPLSVRFTDRSNGNVKSWYWDFGDGTTSTERSPTHVYTKSGVYSVGLMTTYWNGQSKTEVKPSMITAGVVTPPQAQIDLKPGWNFVSIPKMLADGQNTAKSLFGHVDVGGHSIFSYNPRSKSWNTISATTVINPLDAVWIYSTRGDDIYLYFAGDALQIPPTRKLVKGWNTFGVTSLNTVPANNALLSVKNQWIYVIGFDSSTQRYQGTIMNVPESSAASLYPGYGYWIYMSDEGDLAAIGM